MTVPANSRAVAQPSKRKLTYRGVILQRPATRSRFTIKEIKKAVEDAVAKNADTLANRE